MAVEPSTEGDMPGSVRVACASNGGDELDGHCGAARHFLGLSSDAGRFPPTFDSRDPDGGRAVTALSPSVLKSARSGPVFILAGNDAVRSGKDPRDTLFTAPGLGDQPGGEAT